jgi:hypothetical protein
MAMLDPSTAATRIHRPDGWLSRMPPAACDVASAMV